MSNNIPSSSSRPSSPTKRTPSSPTKRSPPSSPTKPPPSPTKPGLPLPDGLKANAHPYAIKTTSTGILSRSATTAGSQHQYGVKQQAQRSLLLGAARQLNSSARGIWPQHTGNGNGGDFASNANARLSGSPTKSHFDDDTGYLSSSSASSSSITGTGTRRRRNGRVHGMVASLESTRDRAGSISSTDDDASTNYPSSSPAPYPTHSARPLPAFPPLGSSTASRPSSPTKPFLLPTSSFPPSLAPLVPLDSAFNTPQATGHTVNASRPLPVLPAHPSLRAAPPGHKDGDGSGEMTMEDLLAVLGADDAGGDTVKLTPGGDTVKRALHVDVGKAGDTVKPLRVPLQSKLNLLGDSGDTKFSVDELLAVQGENRKGGNGKKEGTGGDAWVDSDSYDLSGTMKRVPDSSSASASDSLPEASKTSSKPVELGNGDAELSVHELLALAEGPDANGEKKRTGTRTGGDAWVDTYSPSGTMKRISDSSSLPAKTTGLKPGRRTHVYSTEPKPRPRRVGDVFDFSSADGVVTAQEEAESSRQPETTQTTGEAGARDEAEARALEQELNDTRRLVDQFKRRLEEVEARVGAMEEEAATAATVVNSRTSSTSTEEAGDSNLNTTANAKPESQSHPLRLLAAWALSTPLGSALRNRLPPLPLPLLNLLPSSPSTSPTTSTTTSSPSHSHQAVVPAKPTPTHVTRALHTYARYSGYALLLGIGVCAVVLRGLVRLG
ncbi:hypothetical protein DXG03_006284, partial [Asterophora parasitica]